METANNNRIAIVEDDIFDTTEVDIRTVERARITDGETGTATFNYTMATRDSDVVEKHRRLGVATNRDRVRID